MSHSRQYLDECAALVGALDADALEGLVAELAALRDRGGRLFVLGVGGSAAHASHATADLRKMCGIEAYAPTDNVAELTARTNDEGWSTTFSAWLEVSRLGADDALLVFSVGGGDAERGISPNLVAAVDLAVSRGARVLGVVGRDGGHTARHAAVCVIVPPRFEARVTAHTEAIAAVVWHLLVSHPLLHRSAFKWESSKP
ncbi:MAG: SIS domain-containing protein [Proteobacteria bacterium]|nr:SIS domain-containing protein [Pseudomonadota bacterium]